MARELGALVAEAGTLLPGVVALRRRIHAEPELGLELPKTQQAVLEALADLDLEISIGGRTSAVVATLRGARPGPTLMLVFTARGSTGALIGPTLGGRLFTITVVWYSVKPLSLSMMRARTAGVPLSANPQVVEGDVPAVAYVTDVSGPLSQAKA